MAEGGASEDTHRDAPAVFVSYASEDAAVANSVVATLEKQGVRCWIAPRDVVPGEFYAGAIVHAIDAAKVLVLVLSEHAATSPHVLREVERASSRRHPLVSLRIDVAPIPAHLEYFLNASHWLDASAAGLERALPALVRAVRRAVAPVPSGEQPGLGGSASSAPPPALPPAAAAQPARRLRLMAVGAAVVISVALAFYVVSRLSRSSHVAQAPPAAAVAPAVPVAALAPTAVSEKSVAVLPFLDMSEKKDQGYFSDGLSEELINRLTRIPGLRIPARTSAFFFKGKQATIAEIATALGVAHVLEGSVRLSGRTLRITAQLIRADGGYHLWSETFDRPVGDIFKVQDEIATAVAHALKVSVISPELLHTRPPASIEAYTLYLQALLIGEGNRRVDFEAAIGRLKSALQIDPSFTGAWSALALNFVWASQYGTSPSPALCVQAHDAVAHALKLEPTSTEAHRAMGNVLWHCDQNLKAAAAEIKRVLDLEPNNTLALKDSAWLASDGFDRPDEGRQLAERAVALDPMNPWNYQVLAAALMNLDRLTESEAAFRQAIALVPTAAELHVWLAVVLMDTRRPAEALAELGREPSLELRERVLPFALNAVGRTKEADAEIRRFEIERGANEPEAIAEFYACRSDADRAMPWLERAVAKKIPVGKDPKFLRECLRKISTDPRYKALQLAMKLPE